MVTIVFMLTIILHFADPAFLRADPTPILPLANRINRIADALLQKELRLIISAK